MPEELSKPFSMKKPPKIIGPDGVPPKMNKPLTSSKGLLKKVKPAGSNSSSARGDELDMPKPNEEPLFNTPIRRSKDALNTIGAPEESKSYQKPRFVVKRHDRADSDSTGKASPAPPEPGLPKGPLIKKAHGPSLLVKGATPLANRVIYLMLGSISFEVLEKAPTTSNR